MKKIILLLLIAGISYGQARQTAQDSITAHRTEIDALTDSTEAFSDTLDVHRTDIDALNAGVDFTGNVTFGDNDSLKFGDDSDAYIMGNSATALFWSTVALQVGTTNTTDLNFSGGGATRWRLENSTAADLYSLMPQTTSSYNIGGLSNLIKRAYIDTVSVSQTLLLGDGVYSYWGVDSDLGIMHNAGTNFIIANAGDLKINATTDTLFLGTGASYDWVLNQDGNIIPLTGDTYDLGSSAREVDSVFAQKIIASDSIALGGTTITSTAAELNYSDGVTSNIQTQIDAKLTTSTLGAIIVDTIQAQTEYRSFVVSYPQANQELVPLHVGNKQVTEVFAAIDTTSATSVRFNVGYGTDIGGTVSANILSNPPACSLSTQQSYTDSINTSFDQINSDQYLLLDIGVVTGTVRMFVVTVGLIEGN